MISAKYGVHNNILVWEFDNLKRCSLFVRSLSRLKDASSRSCSIIKDGF